MKTVRLVFVDGDETTLRLGDDGAVPETFTSLRGVTYPCPQTGAATACASLKIIIGRIHRDTSFGVPDVKACYADPMLIWRMVAHDISCSKHRFYSYDIRYETVGLSRHRHIRPVLGPPEGRCTDHVAFFNPEGQPIGTSDIEGNIAGT